MRFHNPYFDRAPANIAVLENRDQLGYWLPRLGRDSRDLLAVDTETTGLKWDADRVGGLCLAAGDTAIYTCKDALGPSIEWLADQVKRERQLAFHNGKFDLHQLRGTFGLKVRYPVDDVMIMSFLLDNRGAPTKKGIFGGHDLKELGVSYVDIESRGAEDALYEAVVASGGSRAKKKNKRGGNWKSDILLAPTEIVGRYGAMDAWMTLQLAMQFRERINHWIQPDEHYPPLRVLYDTEQWVMLALVEMEQQGVLVNPEFFEKWKADLEQQKEEIERNLRRIAGREINWGSAPQLRELLFNHMGLEPSRWTKGGKRSGPQPSTDEVAILNLNHPIAEWLTRLRDVDKQLGTYANGLLRAIRADGRIHCNFKQTGARTGRLSAEDPNLQQVPRASGARDGFVTDPGLVLRFADYSQVEMRFAAHLSNDPTLVRGFLFDPDFDTHAATAKKMWGLAGEPTKEQRKFAKIMNFAMLYGAGEDKVTSQLIGLLQRREAIHAIKSFGNRPDRSMSPHRQLAKLLMSRYFEEFRSIKSARYAATDTVKRRGYSMNEFGRHRYLDDSESYKGFNSEIQGSAADLAKRGLASVYRELQHSSGEIALLLQIHDEIVYLSDGNPRTDKKVLEILDERRKFRVPMVADMSGSTTTWQNKVSIDLKKAA